MEKKKKSGFIKGIDLHKFLPRASGKAAPPGTIEYIGKPQQMPTSMEVISYGEQEIQRKKISTVEDLRPVLSTGSYQWIQITGLQDVILLQQLGELFQIDALNMEVIANTTERPDIEEYEHYIFVVLKSMQIEPQTREIIIEQISVIVGKNYLISLHETPPVLFEPLYQRIVAGGKQADKFTPDYLLFAICDLVIDNYFSLLENLGETIETIEDELISSPSSSCQQLIYKSKRQLFYAKKIVWPTREVIGMLQSSLHPLITDHSRNYFRNIHDHVVQIIETIESLLDLSSNMMDLYLSTVSNRLNEIMKVLTIFSALFIPMTFLAGVYGMNFKGMPELDWKYGYIGFWGVVIVVVIVMLLFFKHKKWA
ncbi:MAG: magnesium/cobalt transporter CorA [Candidatus Azobacteroides sp.]|nr:magnesium/cobalt transporter CorA [Candidatus Azobacteroides sp.]